MDTVGKEGKVKGSMVRLLYEILYMCVCLYVIYTYSYKYLFIIIVIIVVSIVVINVQPLLNILIVP